MLTLFQFTTSLFLFISMCMFVKLYPMFDKSSKVVPASNFPGDYEYDDRDNRLSGYGLSGEKRMSLADSTEKSSGNQRLSDIFGNISNRPSKNKKDPPNLQF